MKNKNVITYAGGGGGGGDGSKIVPERRYHRKISF